jgi:hypothetical protein
MAGDTYYQPSEKSIILQLLDADNLLNRYEHNLRGEELQVIHDKDESGKEILVQKWVPKFTPKMNDLGITSTMSYLRIICDKCISMTDITEEMAGILSNQNADQFWTFLTVNSANFGLQDESKINEAYYPIYDLIVSRFHSCVDGMIVNAVSVTTSVTEQKTVAPEQQQESKGFNPFSFIRPKV